MARIARVVVPGACYVGRSLARSDHKRKVKIPKIKYGVLRITVSLLPRITQNYPCVTEIRCDFSSRLFRALDGLGGDFLLLCRLEYVDEHTQYHCVQIP